jgi:hypothetical protein
LGLPSVFPQAFGKKKKRSLTSDFQKNLPVGVLLLIIFSIYFKLFLIAILPRVKSGTQQTFFLVPNKQPSTKELFVGQPVFFFLPRAAHDKPFCLGLLAFAKCSRHSANFRFPAVGGGVLGPRKGCLSRMLKKRIGELEVEDGAGRLQSRVVTGRYFLQM